MTDPAPITVRVESEIEPLGAVLIHRPGEEVVRMTQRDLDLLLFDDILSPEETVREHDVMTQVLAVAGARVVEMEAILARALAAAPRDAVRELLRRVRELAGIPLIPSALLGWAPERLARALVAGLAWDELGSLPPSLPAIRAHLAAQPMALPPAPNLMFQRDPCMAVGDRVVVGRMATEARAREPWLVAFALKHSGIVAAPRFVFTEEDAHRHRSFRSLEGGDMLVLSPRVLLVGCSQRTSAQTVERLAAEALFPEMPALERVYAVLMPEERTVMHLDTILTQIDRELFLGHAPLVAAGPRALPVVRLARGRPPELVAGACVLDILREELGPTVDLVPCGGDDPLHQEREQWTDGANALCLAPGRIILYARNVHTIAALAAHGFEEVNLHWVQPEGERQARIASGMARGRTVFSFSGSELSRARGGGRCLTMPLRRGAAEG